MLQPELKFELNMNLDVQMGSEFIDLKAGGVDFGQGIIQLYPDLAAARSTTDKQRQQIIREYVTSYYANNNLELENILASTHSIWSEVEENFFKATDNLFAKHMWPQGEYICFLSIFNCNPRFLENKTFQVYYKHPQGTNHVIAHEMLHFIFCDYFEKQYGEFYHSLNEEKKWQISEVFNDFVLDLPDFEQFKSKDNFHYPEIYDLFFKIKTIISNNFTINNFSDAAKLTL